MTGKIGVADKKVLVLTDGINNALFLSVRTVETHRAHIMQKLRITTRAELVRYALSARFRDA